MKYGHGQQVRLLKNILSGVFVRVKIRAGMRLLALGLVSLLVVASKAHAVRVRPVASASAPAAAFVAERTDDDQLMHAVYARLLPLFRRSSDESKQYHVWHILLKDERHAKATLTAVENGMLFEDAARRDSVDVTSGQHGGDIGWSTANPSPFVAPFADALRTLGGPGLYPQPVHTVFGWHIIRITEVRVKAIPSFEQMLPLVEAAVRATAPGQMRPAVVPDVASVEGSWVLLPDDTTTATGLRSMPPTAAVAPIPPSPVTAPTPARQTVAPSHIAPMVAAGAEVLLSTHAKWDAQCNSRSPPSIIVLTQPEHGILDTRNEQVTASTNVIGNNNCMGHSMSGVAVYYQASSSFHGTDTLSYSVSTDKWTRVMTVDVTVQ